MAIEPWCWKYSENGRSGPLRLLLVQPTPFCNIDCKYCYLPARTDTRRMPLTTFAKILERVVEARLAGRFLTVLWHGGEPLSMPVSFYRSAFETAARVLGTDQPFQFNFQTNGTLISAEFCKLARETRSRIGVSIDGPAFLTDANRVYRGGRGAFEAIMRGISALRTANVPFSVISVLTEETLHHPDDWFDFMLSIGADEVGLNIDEIEAANTSSSFSRSSETRQLFNKFASRIHARICADPPRIRFREFDQLQASLCFGTSVFSRLTNPFSIVSVDVEGNFSTFSPELLYNRAYVFGNVHTDRFEDAAESPLFKARLHEIEQGTASCRAQCGYFSVCGGGSPSNKVAENGTATSTETVHCLYTRQLLTDVILARLEDGYRLGRPAPSEVDDKSLERRNS